MSEPEATLNNSAPWSIRRRLVGSMVLVSIGILLLSGPPVRLMETDFMAEILRQQFSNSLESLVPVLQDHVIKRDAEMDLPVLQRIVSDFLNTHEEVLSMRIEDALGATLVADQRGVVPGDPTMTFRVSRELRAGDFIVGRAELVVDLQDLEYQVASHVWQLQVVLTGLLFLVALVLVLWFYRLAIHPLRLIDEKLRNLIAGREIVSAEFKAADEFVRLNDSVDALASAVRLEERQRELELQLQQSQKLEAIGRLAGGVAHDFNNLLTVILGYAETLVDDPRLDAAARNGAEQIVSAGERASALTRQLLVFSRKQVLRSSVVNPVEVFAGMEEMLERLIGELVEVSFQVVEPVGMVKIDSNQLEQVLMNLAVNARDAVGPGGHLRLRLFQTGSDSGADSVEPLPEAVAPGNYVVLSVQDDGAGMDAETQSRVFEPFFTTKESGEGTGLGLAMVYGIVTQSGGHIDIQSSPGRGTTFRIYLPVTEGELEAETKGRGSDQPFVGGTVLVVEDEGLVRTLTCEILEGEGYEVLVPGMSGPELSRAVCQRRPGIGTLLVSGYDNFLLAPEERELPFLQKPFDRAALLGAVREALRPRA